MVFKMADKLRLAVGLTTIFLILVIIIFDVVTWSKRAVFYSFKAQPAPNTSTTGSKSVTTYNVYYPNGKPDPKTGKPANASTVPSGIQNTLNTNLNAYLGSSGLQGPNEWGYNNGS